MYQRTNIRRGMAVLSHDGVHVGRVIDVTAEGIVLERGQFFLRDFHVPFDDISSVRGDELILVRDRAALRQSDSATPEETRAPAAKPEVPHIPQPHEPPQWERRAAGPGWDPLSVDEEQEEAQRAGSPDAKDRTRY